MDKIELKSFFGMRKIKSVLALLLTFLMWQIVRIFFPALEVHPGFAYIYAVLDLRDSVERTVDLGVKRIKATIVGIVFGMSFIALSEFSKQYLQDNGQLMFELFLILFGTLLSLVFGEKLKCQTMCGIAPAVFLICMVWHADSDRYLYAILRVIQTLMGVFAAWIINVKIKPRHSSNVS